MEEIDPGDEEYCWKMEDFQEYSKAYDLNSQLSWIWRKGVNLGKKMVVTGVVVSSATIVLPPLVALSAIGFAFSVPAGFVIATYACGEKLMNTLLPLPSPSIEQYESTSSDNEEFRIYNESSSHEEREYEEDTRKSIESRIELVEENNREINNYNQIPVNKGELDKWSSKVSEILEDVGCEEDAEECMEDEEIPALDSNVIPDILEGIKEAEEEISCMDKEKKGMPRNSLRAVVLEAQIGVEDENNVDQVTKGMAFVPPRVNKIDENEYVENLAGVEENELRSETTGLIEKMRDESEKDQQREQSSEEKAPEGSEECGEVPKKGMLQDTANANLTVITEEAEPALDDKEMINSLESDANFDYVSFELEENDLMHDEPKSVVETQLVVNVKIDGDHTVTEVHQGSNIDKIGTFIFPTDDAREMVDETFILHNEQTRDVAEESGIDLPDNGSVALDEMTESMVKIHEGEDQSTSNVVGVAFDYHEVVIESAMPAYNNADAASDQGTTTVSDKVKVDEEKVWEQINALRTIVGCTETPHTSYAEELNALYVFTGVEPPVSTKGPADLTEIDEKLHFLMSIVGVK